MPRRYFFSSSASRPIQLEGREYRFIALSVLGGRVSGVFDTEDETDQAILARGVERRIGITEMTAEQAAHAKKKLQNSPRPSLLSSSDGSPRPRMANSPAGAILPMVENGARSAASAAKPEARSTEITMPTIVSMMKVGRVKPPQPFATDGRGKKP